MIDKTKLQTIIQWLRDSGYTVRRKQRKLASGTTVYLNISTSSPERGHSTAVALVRSIENVFPGSRMTSGGFLFREGFDITVVVLP